MISSVSNSRQDLQVGLQRRARLDRRCPALAPAARMSRATPTGLSVASAWNGDVVGAGLRVGRRPPVRVVDHQMAVHRDVGDREQALHHRQSQRQIRHEVVVHHVDVHPVGAVHGRRPRRPAGRSRRPGSTARSAGAATCGRLLDSSATRSAAANIASVPCRCGHSWTYGPSPRSSTPARTAAGCPAPSPAGGAARRRPRRPSRPDAVNTSRTAPRRRAGSARSPLPAARAAASPARARRRAGAASAPRAGAAARPDRCTARRPAPGRIAGSRPDSRPSTRSTSTGKPRVFSLDELGTVRAGSTAVTRAPDLRADAPPAARSCRPGPRTGPASDRRRRRRAPASAPGRPAGCPRPGPAPRRRARRPAARGRRPGRYTAYGE